MLRIENLNTSRYFLSIKNKKILLLSSKFHSKQKYFKIFVDNLKKRNNLQIFTDINSGALINDLKIILKNFKTPNIIIGIGGGSVMDISKACSCLFLKKNYMLNFSKSNFKKKIYTVLVPTILGSGAETSRGAILQKKNKQKIAIRHNLIKANRVFVDLNIVKLANKKLMSENLYDCLSHAIETYISKLSNQVIKKRSLLVIEGILKFKSKKNFLKKSNLKRIANYSSMMGKNLVQSSTCLPHRIQYAISRFTNASHAQGIIAIHKGWLKMIYKKKLNSYSSLNQRLLKKKINLVKDINKFKKNFQINYNLDKIGIRKHMLKKISKYVDGKIDLDPNYMNRKDILNILKKSL